MSTAAAGARRPKLRNKKTNVKPWLIPDFGSSDESDHDDLDLDKLMDEQTTRTAEAALKFYNEREGVQFVLDKPLISNSFMLPCKFVYHANFTAKKLVDTNIDSSSSSSSSSGESSPPSSIPSQMFFAEVAKIYGKGLCVLTCVTINPRDRDHPVKLVKGCLRCPARTKPVIYHPKGQCHHGEHEEHISDEFCTPDSTPCSSPGSSPPTSPRSSPQPPLDRTVM